MKAFILAGAMLLAIGATTGTAQQAKQGTTCKIEAAKQEQAGVIQASFMKKCETEAAAKCEANANDRNLQGPARVDFMKQCFSAAVGT
jgi:hypothetical protein